MFHDLYKYLKKENLLEQSYKKCNDSLKLLTEMFQYAREVLRNNRPSEKNYDIYLKDRIIDEHEREIRKKSLTHLAMSDMEDLNATLVLISIVHDIERIGDYTTNIYELNEKNPEILEVGDFEKALCEIEQNLQSIFKELTKIEFVSIDKESALKWIGRINQAKIDLDIMLETIVETANELPINRKSIIILTLYLRYLKRIASHLYNIISSFVNPFDRIGSREIINGN